MDKPLVSVIIPCYNSGKYLPEALDSVTRYHDASVYEIIIVDDGSTDAATIELLNTLKNKHIVISQENRGPAAARNTGVKAAKGEYLLMLDSDNKIEAAYIDEGIRILDANSKTAVVHAVPVFFGDSSKPRFNTGPFDMELILKENYIDNCAIIRRSVWVELGGQDESRAVMSHEDWDFWIRVTSAGYQFHFIDKPLFHYRILNTSLVNDFMLPGGNDGVYSYMYGKHAMLLSKYYTDLLNEANYSRLDRQQPLRSFIKFLRNKYFKK
ncbi:glycosyltransferase family 2 protein [Mucilaginibacter pallidiroseus]|uniref:Glycosyltransferase family 2 protein n=1 Tax=Mucilaginibacter pallidiroseus TaxID=2599295 RepID=A0A563U8B4_9SPHI|nr:glycosyltransferase family A protein [Mucilaginibacter pallidiroseus]TWR27568.1 glycosyltransferase family 2 protein [Mucilaginibacter pallidiroseus]